MSDAQHITTSPRLKIVRSAGIIMTIVLLCKMMGFFEKVILAYLYGTRMELDAYVVAYSIPLTLFVMVDRILGPAFLPIFTDSMIRNGERYTWRVASSLGLLVGILLGVVAVIGVVAAPALISVLAPGFDHQKAELATKLTRMIIPVIVFLGLSTLTEKILNSYKRFVLPVLGIAIYKALTIGSVVTFHRSIGIYSLAPGMAVGALGNLALQAGGLWRKRIFLFQKMDIGSLEMRTMGKLMAPLVVGIVFSQVGVLIGNMFASTLQMGSLSALSYARKIIDLPMSIVPSVLGIVLFPYFSELASKRDYAQLSSMFSNALRAILLMFIPLAIGICVLRVPIVRLLFERGQFALHSTQLTAKALLYYAIGMSAFAVDIILMHFYFALSDTKTPVIVGVGCVLLNIILTVLLVGPLGHGGIALAMSIQMTTKVGLLFSLLRRKMDTIPFKKLSIFSLKTLLASGVMGGVVWWASKSVFAFQGISPFGNSVLTLGLSGLLGVLSFLTFTHVLHIKEIHQGLSLAVTAIRLKRWPWQMGSNILGKNHV